MFYRKNQQFFKILLSKLNCKALFCMLEMNIKKPLIWIFCATGITTGFLYWKFFGCTNGCPLKSNPWLMSGYGLIVGYIVGDALQSYFDKKNTVPNTKE